MKTCSKCGTAKPLSEFALRRGATDGHRGVCRPCRSSAQAAWMAAHPEQRERRRAYSAAWYAANREAVKDRVRHTRRRSWTGADISPEEVSALSDAQGHACAICRTPQGKKAMDLDHNHRTGYIRGLLCHRCNTALGLLRDDPAVIRAAADYLERSDT